VCVCVYQNPGQNYSLLTANKLFENVAKLKYLGTAATHESYFHEEIKSRLHLGNACYRSVQNILSSRIISKILKIKM
jgi:hypothetical protein